MPRLRYHVPGLPGKPLRVDLKLFVNAWVLEQPLHYFENACS